MGRYVITAAHCLPHFPPCASFSEPQDRTYKALLGKLEKRRTKRTVWAECVFLDPISDIAVLTSPDGEELFEAASSYETLVNETIPLRVSAAASNGNAWLLSLAGEWSLCRMERFFDGRIWIWEGELIGGMSGSPILADDGTAVGVVTAGLRRVFRTQAE